jgi:predicted metal-binding membrane protein
LTAHENGTILRPMSAAARRLANDRLTAAALALVAGIAWLVTLATSGHMVVGPVMFVAAWTVMMVAMMLPSAAPLVLLYSRGASARATLLLVLGYLAVWAAAGVPAYIGSELMPMSWSPLVLAAAGVYQLTPAKESCLRKCRAPVDFLMQHWGRSALRLGVEHGLWCLGCCWALMAVLVLVGMMGVGWVVGLTIVVALEKLTTRGVAVSRLTGVALLVAAIIQGVR